MGTALTLEACVVVLLACVVWVVVLVRRRRRIHPADSVPGTGTVPLAAGLGAIAVAVAILVMAPDLPTWVEALITGVLGLVGALSGQKYSERLYPDLVAVFERAKE